MTGAVALSGMVAQPPVDQTLEAGDAYDRSRQYTEDRDLDEETRRKGDRDGWSGQR